MAGAHSHTRAAAQVEHIVHIEVFDGIFHFTHSHLFTFTHKCIVVDVGPGHILAQRAMTPFCGSECHLFAHAVGLLLASLTLLEFRPIEWCGGCGALLVDVKFAASHIGGPFCHQTIGHEFTACDGDKSGYSVALFVVEAHYAAADVSARRIVVGSHKGAHSGIGSEYARGGKAWRKFLTFAQ